MERFWRLAMNTLLVEQRKEDRTQLSWPVSVWLPFAHRFFNGRSSNISKTGVFLNVPVTTPVKLGGIVEINFPRTEKLAEEKGSYSRIKSGKIVRIERKTLLKDAAIGLAVAFN
jgi:hypothetical protein